MTRKRKRRRSVVAKHARASTTAALHGHCTKAFESLSTAQTAYGREKADSTVLGEARQTFFRKCVVPQ